MSGILKVKTDKGVVEGLPGYNQKCSIFKGIPLAKAPEYDLRWKPLKAVDSWEGIYKAYKYPNIAVQERFSSEGVNTLASEEFYVRDYPMSEDCLYLNIWTPAESSEEKLPVAVYFHGGGFETGYSFLNAYDGEGFSKRGIIMVSIPYRLNIFGFLAHPELEEENLSTGNYGLMDQIFGLKWVKRNIQNFGGDPDNITIFGQSAGGMSVRNLCSSPQTKDLFHRAIIQSGGGLSNTSILLDPMKKEEALKLGQEFIDFAGFKSIKEARKADSDLLIKKYSEFKKEKGRNLIFYSNIDGYVIPEAPADYIKKGNHPNIDYMIGCTSDEMRKKITKDFDLREVEDFSRDRFKSSSEKYIKCIQPNISNVYKKYLENQFADEALAAGIAWCENQMRLERKPTYMYYFSYVPPGAEEVGAHHSVEHHYIFQTLVKSRRPYKGLDYELSNELADRWSNFIKCGNPNIKGKYEWKPYKQKNKKILKIDRERKMIKPPVNKNIKFITEYNLE